MRKEMYRKDGMEYNRLTIAQRTKSQRTTEDEWKERRKSLGLRCLNQLATVEPAVGRHQKPRNFHLYLFVDILTRELRYLS
jgi:hypothetical protein